MTFAYLDSSAFVKTILEEPESSRLERWLESQPDRASSALLRTEAIRAVRDDGPAAIVKARTALRTIRLIDIDGRLLDAAGDLALAVRSLEAIHLAAALSLGPDLGSVVTYDTRMQAAADQLGLEVVAP